MEYKVFGLEEKLYDMFKYGYEVTKTFPKSERFALVADIKRVMEDMIIKCELGKQKQIKTPILELDADNKLLRKYLRLALELQFINPHKYGVWSDKLTEIGKMTGGWLKTIEEKSKSKPNKKLSKGKNEESNNIEINQDME